MTSVPTNPSPTGYISFPVTVDPNQLFAQAVADIMAQFPGWTPAEGNLEVVVLEESAQMMSAIAAAATQVPMLIFMAFGQLVNIPPIVGTQAAVTAYVTMVDDAGYTIPAGLQVAFPLTGNSSILFTVQTALTIPFGETTGTLALICETVGSFPNGLPSGTQLQLQQTFAQIISIITNVEVSGGVDPETVTAYINRLSAELQLISPRPILPADFAAMAQNVTGVFRAMAIDGLNPGRTVTDGVTDNGSGIVDSNTADFTDADIGRTVTDTVGNTIIQAGSYILNILSATSVTLNKTASATDTGVTLVMGDLTGQERCITVSGVTEDGTALGSVLDAQLGAYLESIREANFIVNVIDPTITEIDVSVTCIAQAGVAPGGVQTAVVAAIESYLSPANWGGGLFQPPQWNNTPTVSLLGLADAILSVPGVAFISLGDLTLGIHGGSLTDADLTMPGDAPLPTPGVITVLVDS